MAIKFVHVTHINNPIEGIDFWETSVDVDGMTFATNYQGEFKTIGHPKKALEEALSCYKQRLEALDKIPMNLLVVNEKAKKRRKKNIEKNLEFLEDAIKQKVQVNYSESVEVFTCQNFGDFNGNGRFWINE